MITPELARALRDSGLVWHPAAGDAFLIDRPEADAEVFVVSDMTVEAHEYPTGTELGFNGTTEWALDSVSLDEALWLPREDQLRSLLRGAFRSLAVTDDGYAVVVALPRVEQTRFLATTPAAAYGRALLALIDSALVGGVTDDDIDLSELGLSSPD